MFERIKNGDAHDMGGSGMAFSRYGKGIPQTSGPSGPAARMEESHAVRWAGNPDRCYGDGDTHYHYLDPLEPDQRAFRKDSHKKAALAPCRRSSRPSYLP